MVAYDPEGATEEFFLCCLAADKQRVKKGGSRQGGSLRRSVESGREPF